MVVQLAHDGTECRDYKSRMHFFASGSRWLGLLVLALSVAQTGCNRADKQIKVYRVAKAPLDSAPPADSSSGAPPDATSLAFQPGKVPSNWEPQPLSQMRQASFVVHGKEGAVADISFVTLGPGAGNVLDNVNRWLSQLAQPPITAETLDRTVQQISSANGNISIVDLIGEPENGDAKKDGRIIAAIASDSRGTAFYKMRGNRELAGAEKDNFLKWVTSSRAADVSDSSADTKPAPAKPMTPEIKWSAPEDWSQAAPSAMRYASFTSGEGDGKADISVVTFPGDGGNDLDNINRWRQQIGLAPIEAGALNATISPMMANGINFSMVDLEGAKGRTIAGWTRHDGRAWFFKVSGSKEAVEREKPKFVKFLQSVRF